MKFYIGRKECGCIVSACVDSPKFKDTLKEFMSECISDGLTVEHVVSDEGPQLETCIHNKADKDTLDMFKEVSA